MCNTSAAQATRRGNRFCKALPSITFPGFAVVLPSATPEKSPTKSTPQPIPSRTLALFFRCRLSGAEGLRFWLAWLLLLAWRSCALIPYFIFYFSCIDRLPRPQRKPPRHLLHENSYPAAPDRSRSRQASCDGCMPGRLPWLPVRIGSRAVSPPGCCGPVVAPVKMSSRITEPEGRWSDMVQNLYRLRVQVEEATLYREA